MQGPGIDTGGSGGSTSSALLRQPKNGKRAARRQKRSVLVMDDEEFVGSVIRLMLSKSGYTARLTKNGEEAIEQYLKAKSRARPFDVVILDMNIPAGMDGPEAMKRIRALDPEIKAILLTGDINHPAVARYEEYGFRAVLLKPFTEFELIDALKRLTNP